MDKAQWIVDQRIARAERYNRMLTGIEWLQTPSIELDTRHAFQAYVCLYRPAAPSLSNVTELNQGRNTLMTALAERGISTRQGTHAVHALGWYKQNFGYTEQALPNAWMADQLSFALPLYPQMTDPEQDYVVDVLQAIGHDFGL